MAPKEWLAKKVLRRRVALSLCFAAGMAGGVAAAYAWVPPRVPSSLAPFLNCSQGWGRQECALKDPSQNARLHQALLAEGFAYQGEGCGPDVWVSYYRRRTLEVQIGGSKAKGIESVLFTRLGLQ